MSDSFIQLGEETFGLQDSIDSLTRFFSYYDSGLTPLIGSGVILHRYGYGSEQIVYQFEPQFRGVVYKQHEGSDEDETNLYNLPFPYVIIAISYENNIFQGIRHYFSPTPITRLDQQLYMPSLPNTNCKGYNETSVGWVCLYHHTHANFTTLQQKLDYACERYDPISEPYNYGNMPTTDGYNFYKEFKRPKHTWHPATWEKYGKEHGLEWTLALDTWVPIRTEGHGCFAYSSEGYPHNLLEAIYDTHNGYYRTPSAVLLNEYAILSDTEKAQFRTTHMRRALVGGMSSVKPKPKQMNIKEWVESLNFPIEHVKQILQFGVRQVCVKCGSDFTFQTFQPPNTLVNITGIKSGKHKALFDWYCVNCINDYCATLSHELAFYISIKGDENLWVHIPNNAAISLDPRTVASIVHFDIQGATRFFHGEIGHVSTDIGGGVPIKRCNLCNSSWLDDYPGFSDVYDQENLEVVGCRQCVSSAFDLKNFLYIQANCKYIIDYYAFFKFFNPTGFVKERLLAYFKAFKQIEVYVPLEDIIAQIKKRFDIDINSKKAITSTILQGLFNCAYGYSGGDNEDELHDQLLVFADTFNLLEEKETEGKKPTKPTKKVAAKKPNLYKGVEDAIKEAKKPLGFNVDYHQLITYGQNTSSVTKDQWNKMLEIMHKETPIVKEEEF